LRWKPVSETVFQASPQYNFHTQRAPGSTFRFNIEADEHLYDKKGVKSMYQVTLANQARDSADFLLTLGDIFGDDHTPLVTTSDEMKQLRKDYLQFLSTVCHSVPFYVCLGNHEGENGFYLNQTAPNNIAVYSTL
jgi:DNA repair exonuclease SbcCD nuclease subunit